MGNEKSVLESGEECGRREDEREGVKESDERAWAEGDGSERKWNRRAEESKCG